MKNAIILWEWVSINCFWNQNRVAMSQQRQQRLLIDLLRQYYRAYGVSDFYRKKAFLLFMIPAGKMHRTFKSIGVIGANIASSMLQVQRQHPDSKWMLSILNHNLRIQRDLHLISSSKMYPGRNIKRSYFSIRH